MQGTEMETNYMQTCDFLHFRYFLNNLLLIVFKQNTLSKFVEVIKKQQLIIHFLEKNAGTLLSTAAF